jgi:hypothetical protein
LQQPALRQTKEKRFKQGSAFRRLLMRIPAI